jgi:hypothetical protein
MLAMKTKSENSEAGCWMQRRGVKIAKIEVLLLDVDDLSLEMSNDRRGEVS